MEIRRIRKRGEKVEDYQESITQEEVTQKEEQIEEEEPDNFMNLEQLKQAQRKYQVRKTINEINAELTDDKRSQLVESNFWDETHWHFVGRYE